MKMKKKLSKTALSSCLGKLSILGLLNYSLSTRVTVHFDKLPMTTPGMSLHSLHILSVIGTNMYILTHILSVIGTYMYTLTPTTKCEEAIFPCKIVDKVCLQWNVDMDGRKIKYALKES